MIAPRECLIPACVCGDLKMSERHSYINHLESAFSESKHQVKRNTKFDDVIVYLHTWS